MSADEPQDASHGSGVATRVRRLSDEVLPEALGLCFVAIIFGGFAAAWLVAERVWDRQTGQLQAAQAHSVAQVLATSAGQEPADEREAVQRVLALSKSANLRAMRWTDANGQLRLAWPPGANLAPSNEALVARADVRTPAGVPAGTVEIQLAPTADDTLRGTLFCNWGIATCATLIVFALVYRRLRRHLRPLAAVQRNLQNFAAGVEKDLLALTLSDSLGSVAQAWNQLLSQLGEAQRHVRATGGAERAQEVLTRFEGAVFRRLVERLPFGVLSLNSERKVQYANPIAGTLLGHPDGLVGRPFGEVVPDPAVTQVLDGAQARSALDLTVDTTRTEAGAEASLRLRVLPLHGGAGAGGSLLVTVEDIAPLREQERARDNFLYHVTHELRTPLTSIHAYAETLTKPGFEDEQTRKECYNVIISETRRLSGLIEDILSLSQLEVGTARLTLGEVDLVRLVRQMVQDNLGTADEKQIDLTLTLPPKVPKIQGDKQRLSVLLMNLIGNALKYTPPKGTVQVTVGVGERAVSVAVRDSGIGISPQDQAHVFEKFYRAEDDRVQAVTGTGLGLAIAREVARLHGGDIALVSEPGAGSTFTLELPLQASEPAEVGVR